jgi:hypothetical protein
MRGPKAGHIDATQKEKAKRHRPYYLFVGSVCDSSWGLGQVHD